jgi:hypothetical protein
VVIRCCLCKSDGETIDHLLLHCKIARELWYAIFSRFGLSWVMPSSLANLFACWWMGGSSWSAIVWKIVPLCLMWCLRRERNVRCFQDLERTLEELKSFFFFSLFTWTAVCLAHLVISFFRFSCSLFFF